MRKEHLIDKAVLFPQAFKILPIVDGKPKEQGIWAAYPNDESTLVWVDTSHQEALNFYSEQIKKTEEHKMSAELTIREEQTIKTMIATNMKAIQSILPKHITPERFARIAYTSIVSNPMLARCSQLSLINSVIESSVLGLEIGGAMREACLIPFKNNKTKTYEATLVIEYPGLIKLAKNTGEVKNISVHPVFENDEFRYNYGLSPDLIHTPAHGKKGELTYAYCIIWYTNGGVDFEVVGTQEAESAKNKSAAKFKSDSPWNQKENWPSMWMKTAIRRIMKRVPKAAEQRFMQVDGMSGSIMEHVGQKADIVELSADDFHGINLKSENGPKKNNASQPTNQSEENPKEVSAELSKDVKQAVYLSKSFPDIFKEACKLLEIDPLLPLEEYYDETAVMVCQKVGKLVDAQN